MTTYIVMLYLFMNITGRFSVIIFGLTYGLKDESMKHFPAVATNWTSSILLAKNATDPDAVEKGQSRDPTLLENTSV